MSPKKYDRQPDGTIVATRDITVPLLTAPGATAAHRYLDAALRDELALLGPVVDDAVTIKADTVSGIVGEHAHLSHDGGAWVAAGCELRD